MSAIVVLMVLANGPPGASVTVWLIDEVVERPWPTTSTVVPVLAVPVATAVVPSKQVMFVPVPTMDPVHAVCASALAGKTSAAETIGKQIDALLYSAARNTVNLNIRTPRLETGSWKLPRPE